MILRELYYFDDQGKPVEDETYEPIHDDSPLTLDDTRKTKLTLKQINRIRKASETHTEESKKDLEFIKQMYGIAANAEAGGV